MNRKKLPVQHLNDARQAIIQRYAETPDGLYAYAYGWLCSAAMDPSFTAKQIAATAKGLDQGIEEVLGS